MALVETAISTSTTAGTTEATINSTSENSSVEVSRQPVEDALTPLTYQSRADHCTTLETELEETLTSCNIPLKQQNRGRSSQTKHKKS